MSQAYDRSFCDLARMVARDNHLTLREGVYAGLSGPSFESPADLRFLRTAGADAVGMSTTSEASWPAMAASGCWVSPASSNKPTWTVKHGHLARGSAGLAALITPKLETLTRGVLSHLMGGMITILRFFAEYRS